MLSKRDESKRSRVESMNLRLLAAIAALGVFVAISMRLDVWWLTAMLFVLTGAAMVAGFIGTLTVISRRR